ncbi:DUF4376 domain-containing protein [Campylobacter jejuni]|uniref:DUF4376 domain-containing protein n=1 Tax=Campylobacter jejuni TaxID=197 RepID=UPI001308896B|nr:DUF4376 domain-containing protein [Campylobacter jejuni]EAI4845942.1 DUF4376 domain-containing protein [Campylobacter jejuni]EAI6346315.1 DUF4376 domain-containing protein [Campylobacter jejuni]EAI8595669.1 DUF4376 domain-containing protein [Campylobacter jejuni]EAI8630982.1 DUF4376 domain-containing protein [Campylobacter jejuni]ECK7542872.1 DUF4376 domain-containing protein [Campylobacter jejuni]
MTKMQNVELNTAWADLSVESIKANLQWALTHPYFNHWLENADASEALEIKKELKKAEITQKRDEAINGGVEYKGKVFQSAEKDRNLLTSTISLFSVTKQVPDGFKWIAKDNEAVSFTLEDLIALGGLMANAVNLYTMKARELKDKIEQALIIEELDLITWDNEN